MSDLVIVESPAKAKKIQAYLGSDYIVKASVGHIRDLPIKSLGVDIDNGFKPSYEISEGKSKIVNNLRSIAKKSNNVYLAADLDREGEAIAWHVKSVLKLKDYHRITFNEITKSAIQQAIQHPRDLNYKLIAAQEARRILDRLYGYLISPELGNGLSAGRVQSPTVKIIATRESDIVHFKSIDHYSVDIELEKKLTLSLAKKPFLIEPNQNILDRSVCEKIADVKRVKAIRVECFDKTIAPAAPFTTSSLQQTASKYLKFDATKTMKLAQSLYEAGFITYMRTDDPNLSEEAFLDIQSYLNSRSFECHTELRKWPAKGGAQEAHECIRPTGIENDTVAEGDEQRLYQLIRERTIAACSLDAIDSVTRCAVESVGAEISAVFIAQGKIEKKRGWREVLTIEKILSKDKTLPVLLTEGNEYTVCQSEVLELKTSPPNRYTEATLLKKLEKLEIGRPSTYASILKKILDKKYIRKDKKGFYQPTELGNNIVKALSNFSFMDIKYTKNLEDELDNIAKGNLRYLDLLTPNYAKICEDIQTMERVEEDHYRYDTCQQCTGKIKLIEDKYWVHCASSEETPCLKYIDNIQGKPYYQHESQCQYCGDPIERKFSKNNDRHFWVHSAKVQCDIKFIDDKEGNPDFSRFSKCGHCNTITQLCKSKNKKENYYLHLGSEIGDCEKYISI